MRNLIAGCGAIALCLIVAGFLLANKSKAALRPGILTAQVDQIVGRWNAENTPETDRVMDLVVSDALEAETEKKAEKPSGYSSAELELLSSAKKPPAMKRFGAWFHRTFFRRNMSAGEDTVFVESLANNKPNAAVWTHKGEETASEEEMTKEFMKAIMKADDAGAQVNIITDGVAIVAALQAVRALGNVKLTSGRVPAVAKIMAVNMNRATLARRDFKFSDFSRPDNLKEIVFVWNPPATPKETKIEISSPKYNWKRLDGTELLPMMGGAGTQAQKLFQLLNVMAKSKYTMEAVAGHLETLLEEKRETARAEERKKAEAQIKAEAKDKPKEMWSAKPVKRDLMGRTYDVEPAKPAQPVDSLSAITGGWMKEEQNKAEKTAGVLAHAYDGANTNQRDSKQGNAAYCKHYGTGIPRCNWLGAKAYCGGHLPTVNQLKTWYNNENPNGGGTVEVYWSSEEVDESHARSVGFYVGDVSSSLKSAKHDVRCAR